jgi:RNA polymerase sigma-70 factor (ECF subfamily)
MTTTSLTLLDRLRRSDHPDAWDRFVRLYTPLVLRWAQLQGFNQADAEDLAQIVLVKLIRLLPGYEPRDGSSFRGWLFTIWRNECHDFRTRQATRSLPGDGGLSTVAAPTPVHNPDEAEYRQHLVRRALELVRSDFSAATWSAFTRFVLEGVPAAEVARGLGMTANAVYMARNRVLTRLREELAGLLD